VSKSSKRLVILGAVLAAFVLIDGIVLAATGGLSSDATPIFPVLGGPFAKTRSSGTSLIIIGALLALLTAAGGWLLARRGRRRGAAGHTAPAHDAGHAAPAHVAGHAAPAHVAGHPAPARGAGHAAPARADGSPPGKQLPARPKA
jgi:hypothetical protein